MKRALFIGLACVATASSVWSANTDWIGGTTNYNDASNWSNGVPDGSDAAVFTSSAPFNLSVATGNYIGSLLFTAGAAPYAISVTTNTGLFFVGSGISNQSNFAQTININAGGIVFNNNSTSSSATITNVDGSIGFTNTSQGGTAKFTNSGSVQTGYIYFNTTADAQNATFTNNAGGTLLFFNTASASSATIVNNAAGNTNFYDNSTAGVSSITLNSGSSVNFSSNSTAGSATITAKPQAYPLTSGFTTFTDNATAGNATINNIGGVTTFSSFSTAGNATINNNNSGAQVDFSGNASAGTALILNKDGSTHASFTGQSTAGNATIINTGGLTYFWDNTTAGQATLTNNGSGYVTFEDNSSGANSVLTNNGGGQLLFNGAFGSPATAGHATITNQGNGLVEFLGVSDAGTSSMTNNGGTIEFISTTTASNATISNNSGNTIFQDASTASNATITNYTGGTTQFNNTSTAASAQINNHGGDLLFNETATGGSATVNQSSGVVQFNDATNAGNISVNDVLTSTSAFFNASNAGNSHLTNFDAGSVIQFNDVSNAGNSVLTNSSAGTIQFNNASGGGETAIVNNGGTFTINNVVSPTFNVGSLAGNGSFVLGSHTLDVGSDGTDTSVAGSISGSGGSLVKVGTGTLTLSGVNSYTNGTTVSGGTLAISNDNNLGTGGGLTLTNGVLQTDANITSSRQVTLNSAGGVVATNGFNSSLLGTIQGSGSLVKAGNGTLTLAGPNTYSGGTDINGGTLKVGSANALPSSGAVVLANSSGAQLDLNGFNSTIGSLAGGGSLGGDVALGTGTLTLGSDNTSTSYGGSITGAGTLVKVGDGTLTLSGTNIFTGSTTVNSGVLNLTGTLRGDAIIQSGATFSNSGTMGGLINRGTVIPGINGVGSLTVSDYSGTGTLQIDFNRTSFNNLIVITTATLTGGTLSVEGTNTDFVSGRYSVITATSVMGSFATIVAPHPSYFLTLNTEYTPTSVDVLVHAMNFADAAQNHNQQAVTAALDNAKHMAVGDAATAVQAVYALQTADQVHQAFNQISGDSLAGFQSVGIRSAEVFTSQMNARATPIGFAQTSDLAAPVQLAYAGDVVGNALGFETAAPQKNTTAPASAYGLWTRGLGFIDNTDADSSIGSPSSRATTGGFQVGYDFLLADNVLFGLSGGYASTSLTVSDRSTSGNSTAVQSGVYTSYTPGPWFLNGSMAYTTSTNGMSRTIQFTGINETANANFQSRSFTTFAEAGYRYQPSERYSLEPSISLKASRLQQEAFTESGAPGMDLSVGDQTTTSLVSAMGARLAHRFRENSAHPSIFGIRAAWQHELADADNSVSAQFAETPAAGTFSVQGTPRDRNAAAFGLDGRVDLAKNLQAFGDYSATIGSNQQTYGLLGGVSVKW